jgi:hypothetical protein
MLNLRFVGDCRVLKKKTKGKEREYEEEVAEHV